ncbi:MAG: hypothetical protein PVS3B1_14480 [Ktedonobacteraceae bacterium]
MELWIFGLDARDFKRLLRHAPQGLVVEAIGRCHSDLLANNGAHAQVVIALGHILMDVIGGETREGTLGGVINDFGLLSLREAEHLL